MRRAAKRDLSEPIFREAFEKAGCAYQPLSQEGLPDALVFLGEHIAWRDRPTHTGRIALIEAKTGKAKLKPVQEKFRQRFPVWVIRSLMDVQECVAWLKN